MGGGALIRDFLRFNMGARTDARHGLSLLDPARVHHVAFAAAARGVVQLKRGCRASGFGAKGRGSQGGAVVKSSKTAHVVMVIEYRSVYSSQRQ